MKTLILITALFTSAFSQEIDYDKARRINDWIINVHEMAKSDAQARKQSLKNMRAQALPLLITSSRVSLGKYLNVATQSSESLFLALEAGRNALKAVK
jgi:hypothetical protein